MVGPGEPAKCASITDSVCAGNTVKDNTKDGQDCAAKSCDGTDTHCCKEADDILGSVGASTCPAGYEYITTSAMCNEARNKLNVAGWNGSSLAGHGDRLPFCWIGTGGKASFNGNGDSGNSAGGSKLICKPKASTTEAPTTGAQCIADEEMPTGWSDGERRRKSCNCRRRRETAISPTYWTCGGNLMVAPKAPTTEVPGN